MIISHQSLPFLASILFWYYTDNIFLFFLPFLSIYLRGQVENSSLHRILIYLGIGFSWANGAHFWTTFLLSIEVIRIGLIYGVPFFLRRIGEEMPRDPVGETAFKRAIRILRKLRTQDTSQSLNEYFITYQQYQDQDATEPFTQKEQEQFHKFFTEFSRTSLVVDDGIVLFFPSFIVRIDPSGIDFGSESAMKLIESSLVDACPICREPPSGLSEPWVELNCHHQYCLKCIVRWLREKTECPLCRQVVS